MYAFPRKEFVRKELGLTGMDTNFDVYNWRARVLPVYLTITPIALALAAVVPEEGLSLPLGGAAALVFVPMAFFVSQVGADFGKRLEERLWERWGGAPATRFLRHSNTEFNELTRQRVHTRLRGLGLHVPTKDEQDRDPLGADLHYESCTQELIYRTRNATRFPLVFNGLTEYDFRRNLLGLKPLALFIEVIAFLICGRSMILALKAYNIPATAIGPFLLMGGLLYGWLNWVNEKAVSLTADRYARFLLEAALDLE